MKQLIAFLVVIATSAAYCQTPSGVEKPAVKVGDRWIYSQVDLLTNLVIQTSTIEVLAVEGDTIRTRNTLANRTPTEDNSTTEDNIFDSQWNARHADGRTFKPVRPFYSFPLDVGKTWEGRLSYPNQKGDSQINSQMKGTVVGRESVTVPAGTFQTLRIVITGSYYSERAFGKRGGGGVGKWTIWYAPEVKRHVKLEYEEGRNQTRSELTEYKVN